jgi:long-chain acyl-CoA synthetase
MQELKELTLKALLDQSYKKFPNNNVMSFVEEKAITYSQFYNNVNRVSGFLNNLGIKAEDKVAILSANMPNWGIAYFGISMLGTTVVPILPDFSKKEIENILEHSGAKIIFISKDLYPKITEINNKIKTSILLDNFGIIPENTQKDQLEQIESSIPAKADFKYTHKIRENDLATIIYTSGTTGKSKGVMLSHKNLASNVVDVQSIQDIVETDKFLSILPLSHTYENTLGFLLPILNGASIFYLRKPPTASVLLPALAKVKPSIILSVPMVIEKIYQKSVRPKFTGSPVMRTLYSFSPTRKLFHYLAGKKLKKTFGGNVKFFGVGGAKLDAVVERFLIEGKFPYAVGYGLTETAPMLAGFNPQTFKYRSTGLTMHGVKLKLDNVDSKTGEGEILAKGNNIMMGYYREAKLTKEVFTKDGWFKTGDLATFDKKGYLFIKGRSKSMIVGPSGENIYPEDIESIINNFKDVVESLVIEKKGKIVALVHLNYEDIENRFNVLKEDARQYFEEKKKELLNELHLHINAHVNKFSRIQLVIEQTTPFERTATKKIKRYLYA